MTNEKFKSIEDLKLKIKKESLRKEKERHNVLIVSAGTCGQARGAMKVIDALEHTIKDKKLEDRVTVKVTGCHGFCEAEPNIIIHPIKPNCYYRGTTIYTGFLPKFHEFIKG